MRRLAGFTLLIALGACREAAQSQVPHDASHREVAASAPNPFRRNDRWVGVYTCAQGETKLTLAITEVNGNDVSGVFGFHWGPIDGSFAVAGTYEPSARRAAFRPQAWIVKPSADWVVVGMVGAVDTSSGTYSGAVNGPGCSTFVLRDERSPDDRAPSAEQTDAEAVVPVPVAQSPERDAESDEPSTAPAGSTAEIVPIELTPAQIAEYRKARKSPDVIAIRSFLNHVPRRSPPKSSLPVGLDELLKISPAEISGPFILLGVSGYLLGGSIYTVMFKVAPHRVIRFWPRYGQIRQIMIDEIPPEVQEAGVRLYQRALTNPDLDL